MTSGGVGWGMMRVKRKVVPRDGGSGWRALRLSQLRGNADAQRRRRGRSRPDPALCRIVLVVVTCRRAVAMETHS
jgi:hypothetical protein